jgi:hypothetical protein
MRPAKLITLSAVVGVSLISYGKSTAAQTPVNFPGTVTSSCNITSVGNGAFSEDPGTPATVLIATGGDRGTVVVQCNDSAKSLNLTINSGSSVVYNGTAKIRFNGETGIFEYVNQPALPSAGPITLLLANPTSSSGDTGRIQARIDAPTGKLLKAANDYKIVVDATITP